jgi:hypothetical protein
VWQEPHYLSFEWIPTLVLLKKDLLVLFPFQRKEVYMAREPKDPFDELGDILTQMRLEDRDLISNSEKLVEVLNLEIKHVLLPQLAEGSNQSMSWTDGTINIFISIHVEGEDQFSYSIEVKKVPNKED